MPLDPYQLAATLSGQIQDAVPGLDKLDDYYRGRQPAAFLHPEIAADVAGRLRPLRINWPRVVVDAIHERLRVDGFRLTKDAAPDEDLWTIWQANGLDLWSKIAHRQALKHGRCYLIVWADEADPAVPRITVESAKQVAVIRDPATHRVVAAVKRWEETNAQGARTVYATVLLPDVILRLRTTPDPEVPFGLPSGGWYLRAGGEVPNPLGVVPVVPLVNRPDLELPDGESELEDIADPADGVNKLGTDLMVTAEYYAIPRRWATGTEPAVRPPADEAERLKWATEDNPDGMVPVSQWSMLANRVWTLPEADAKVGQFPEASLTNYVAAINLLTGILAALGKLPPHYVGLNGDNPASADAIRSAEASLVATARDKQEAFADAWEDAMRIAHRIRTGAWDPALLSMETVWADPETRTIAQAADAAVKLVAAEIIPPEQAQEDLGYTPTQRARMLEMRQARALTSAGVNLTPLFQPPAPAAAPAA